MEPMKPKDAPDSSWWPKGWRYAFFPDQCRLAVEQSGEVTQYDTGEHRISRASQAQGGSAGSLRFTSQGGDLDLDSLKKMR